MTSLPALPVLPVLPVLSPHITSSSFFLRFLRFVSCVVHCGCDCGRDCCREMEIALACGAKVIGVNNRNLHTFKLDLDTTERAISIAQKKGVSWRLADGPQGPGQPHMSDIMIAALSGITSNDDVMQFRRAGVSCVLVGETLMKSADPRRTIAELLADGGSASDSKRVLVKTCGLMSVPDAELALQVSG